MNISATNISTIIISNNSVDTIFINNAITIINTNIGVNVNSNNVTIIIYTNNNVIIINSNNDATIIIYIKFINNTTNSNNFQGRSGPLYGVTHLQRSCRVQGAPGA